MTTNGNLSKLFDNNCWPSGRAQAPCHAACPVGTDARGYIRAIARGDFEAAYLIARGPNPLASICGRVCGAPCEAACRRSAIDQAVSIRALKRFVTERFGPESFTRETLKPLELLKRVLGLSGRREFWKSRRRQKPEGSAKRRRPV